MPRHQLLSILQILCGDLGARFVSFGVNLYIARIFVESQFGEYSFLLAVCSFVTGSICVSLNKYYLILNDGEDEEALLLSLIIIGGAVALISVLIASTIFSIDLFETGFLLFAVISNFVFEMVKTFQHKQLAFKKSSIFEIGRALLFGLLFIITLSLIRLNVKPHHIIAIQGLSALATCLYAFKTTKIKLKYKKQNLEMTFGSLTDRRFVCLFYYFSLVALLSQIDILFIKIYGKPDELACYAFANRLYTVGNIAVAAASSYFLPSVQNINNKSDIVKMYSGWRTVVLWYIVLVVMICIMSKDIMVLLSGGQYIKSVSPFILLMVSSIISLAFSPYCNIVLAYKAFTPLIILAIASIGVSIGLNLILYPIAKEVGTAVSTLVSFFIMNYGSYRFAITIIGSKHVPQVFGNHISK
jgi:O-antigen/teichoic acid export membrane protein